MHNGILLGFGEFDSLMLKRMKEFEYQIQDGTVSKMMKKAISFASSKRTVSFMIKDLPCPRDADCCDHYDTYSITLAYDT